MFDLSHLFVALGALCIGLALGHALAARRIAATMTNARTPLRGGGGDASSDLDRPDGPVNAA